MTSSRRLQGTLYIVREICTLTRLPYMEYVPVAVPLNAHASIVQVSLYYVCTIAPSYQSANCGVSSQAEGENACTYVYMYIYVYTYIHTCTYIIVAVLLLEVQTTASTARRSTSTVWRRIGVGITACTTRRRISEGTTTSTASRRNSEG